jgi:nitrile hydratase subunit alpha
MTEPHHDAPGDEREHEHEPVSPAAQVAALEALLKAEGLVSDEFIDAVVDTFSQTLGPKHGARVVARAWCDPAFKQRLLADGKAAAAELGIEGPEGNLEVVENTDDVHNVVVCTLCSCYPWSMLGLPPRWYKSPEYRARMVREPRVLLREMGLDLDPAVEIRVWDSSAEKRYMVLPQCPTDEVLTEAELAALITRDAMVGVARL